MNPKLSLIALLFLQEMNRKLFLQGDKVEVRCSDSGGLDVFISSIDADPSVSHGGITPVSWFGDKGFITGGESSYSSLNKIVFSSESITTFGTLFPSYNSLPAYASNGTIGLILTYEASYTSNNTISLNYSDDSITYPYSTIYTHVFRPGSATNGIVYIIAGGYYSGYRSYLQHGDFESGSQAMNIGNTYYTSDYQSCGINNSLYGLWASCNHNSRRIDYSEFATQGSMSYWAELYTSSRGIAGGSNEEMSLLTCGYYNSTIIQQIQFASQSNSTWFAYLYYGDYELGAGTDGINVLFHCGEYGRSFKTDFASGGITAPYVNWGGTNFDGGRCAIITGNG